MRAILLALLLASTVLAGCASDTPEPETHVDPGPVEAEPGYINSQPDSVTKLEFVARLADGEGSYPSGSGIWPHGDYVYGSALGSGFFIADISDPANPVLVYDEDDDNGTTPFSRDADVVAHPDGRMTLILATQSNGMHVWDVTDPYNPVPASIVDGLGPNHNVAVIPGTELVFNSQSGGVGRTNEIVDVSDPYNAYALSEFGTHGCHDITFFGSFGEPKFRAYCAGIQRTEIWNMDGFDPATGMGIELISTVDFNEDPANSPIIGNPAFQSYPVRTLHHLAMVNEDATVLIIGDEQNGGGTPGACYLYEDNTDASTPFGALFFYNLADESDPTLASWLSPPTVLPSLNPSVPDPTVVDPTNPNTVLNILRPYTAGVPNCTAHFGTIVPGEDKLVMAWYSAGVLLIDFSTISRPFIVDQYQPDPTNPWDARIHGGYVFTGDIVRGMEILKLA